MFLSICNAVFTTLISEFIDNTKYISVKSNLNFSNTKNVSLLIFKGNHIQPSNYIGISKKIQKIGADHGLNIDIKIPKYPFIQHKKPDNTPLFALGHSSGVYDFLMFNNISKFDGLIQIGSILNSNGTLPWKSLKLQSFPIPVLT